MGEAHDRRVLRPGQIEIDPSTRAWSGGIYDEGRRGWLFDLKDKPAAQAAFKQNEWNHYTIEAIGDHFRTWVNGIPVADLQDGMTRTGHIGLQVHSIGNDSTMLGKTIRWRNIVLEDLGGPLLEPDLEMYDHPAAFTIDADTASYWHGQSLELVFPAKSTTGKLKITCQQPEMPAVFISPDGKTWKPARVTRDAAGIRIVGKNTVIKGIRIKAIEPETILRIFDIRY